MASALTESSIDVKLKRFDRVYRQNELVDGTVVINAKAGWAHKGVQMVAEGCIYLTSGRGGLSLDSSSKPTPIFRHEIEVAGPGKFADGTTEIPFSFPVVARDQPLFESYHGVYISVVYNIGVTCDRGMMKKTLTKDLEFIVEVPTPPAKAAAEQPPTQFDISPDSLENVSAAVLASIPKFKVTGRLHRSNYPINQPFTGEVIVKESSAPVRSLELQLVRVESIVSSDGKTTREATEIQNIQIGEGNICREMVVPMYMVFPRLAHFFSGTLVNQKLNIVVVCRLFSCPTVSTSNFKIEFEVNLIIVFGEGYMITENFPIVLSREA